MKSRLILSILALGLCASTSFAQALRPGSSPPIESWSQMWNIANVYHNAPTQANPTLGAKDTSSTTFYLYTAGLHSGLVNADTFTVSPIPADGKISFQGYFWHSSTTSSVSTVCEATLMKSFDGSPNSFIPIVGATVYTITATQALNTATGVPVYVAWDLSSKQGRYFSVKLRPIADTVAAIFNYYFQKPAVWQF